jgi:AAT family amino acid transporter
MVAAYALRPRWGQPLTGIVSLACFTLVAWITWYVFSDPRGPVGLFPYPFVMYLAMPDRSINELFMENP